MKKIVIENTKLPIYVNIILFFFLGASTGALISILPPKDKIWFSIFSFGLLIVFFAFIYVKSLRSIIENFKVEFYLDKIVIKDIFGKEKEIIPIDKVEIILVAYKKFYKVYNIVIYIKTKEKEYHIPIFSLKPVLPELKVFYKQTRKNIQVDVVDVDLIHKIQGAKK